MEPDFSGWATKAGIQCTDGRTIMEGAFEHQDKKKVTLVYAHNHSDPENILGHAYLYHQKGGVRCDGFFNESAKALAAKEAVIHGDVDSLSIWANKLVEKAKQVFHGDIKEVSLVLSGANPGAKIDFVRIAHSDDPMDDEILEDTAIITMGLPLAHSGAELEDAEDDTKTAAHAEDDTEHESTEGKSPKEIYEGLSDEEKDVVDDMLEVALKIDPNAAAAHSDDDPKTDADKADEQTKTSEDKKSEADLTHQEGTENMNRNLFEENGTKVLKHSDDGTESSLTHDDMVALATKVHTDVSKGKSFRESLIAHAEGDYGITNIEVLFPDAQTIDNKPEWITRRMEWVDKVLNGTRKLPYAKIKSQSADLTHEDARAKGYIKATMKKEQYFSIAGRETGPKTIYKKQKLDRDDITDATTFDVVAWMWVEMRFMLREEIARAILIGDGREVDDPDKITEVNIRPIAFDDPFYTDVVLVGASLTGVDIVEAVLRGREPYLGVGEPTAFMTRTTLNEMLLARDGMERRYYRTRAELAQELEVNEIVLVPVMADLLHDQGDVLMVLVNLSDYAVGSTAGGEITTFEDFDIDWNQHKYLIEGRMSGALVKHKTAQVVVRTDATLISTAAGFVPTFNTGTGVVTIPTRTGVVYKNADTGATLSSGAQTAIASGATVEIEATAAAGYSFPHGTDTDWEFTRD